jgi:hypothetical protein
MLSDTGTTPLKQLASNKDMDCDNESVGGSRCSGNIVDDMLPHDGLRSRNAQGAEHDIESLGSSTFSRIRSTTALESDEKPRSRNAVNNAAHDEEQKEDDAEASEESYAGDEETGSDEDGDKNEKEDGESDIEDYPEGDPEVPNVGVGPNDLSVLERELAQLLVSIPRLATGAYDWDAISENASDELRSLIKMKSVFKKFRKSPTELLVKYTRRLKFREHLIGLGWKQKMTITRSTSTKTSLESPVVVPKNARLSTTGLSEGDFSSLSETDKVLATLMAENARLADGRYDWNAIRDQSPVEIQAMIDTKSMYSKFFIQPIDYLVLHSRRKLFRNYLTFLVGSPEGSMTVMKSKCDSGAKATSKGGRKKQAPKGASGNTLKETDDSANLTRNSSIGARLKISVKKIPGTLSSSDDEPKHETTKRKRRASPEGGGRGLSASKNNKELGKLELELAELVELTPKLMDKGRGSYDWDEIQRRASPDLQKLFESKKHMKSFRIWPLHVLVAEAFKYKFREYREQLRKTNSPAEGLLGHDNSVKDEYTGELEDRVDGGREGPLETTFPDDGDDGMAHSMVMHKILEFSPKMTAVNEQFQILSYTATEAKGFLEKLKEIRRERLAEFLAENNLNKRVAEQMLAFQNDDQEMSNQLVKDFLMPRS